MAPGSNPGVGALPDDCPPRDEAGGYATQRDPDLVAEDVRLGRYTAEDAKKLFG